MFNDATRLLNYTIQLTLFNLRWCYGNSVPVWCLLSEIHAQLDAQRSNYPAYNDGSTVVVSVICHLWNGTCVTMSKKCTFEENID